MVLSSLHDISYLPEDGYYINRKIFCKNKITLKNHHSVLNFLKWLFSIRLSKFFTVCKYTHTHIELNQDFGIRPQVRCQNDDENLRVTMHYSTSGSGVWFNQDRLNKFFIFRRVFVYFPRRFIVGNLNSNYFWILFLWLFGVIHK